VEVVVGLDQTRREAVAEEMTLAATAAVGSLRVTAVQDLHAVRQTLARRLDDGVVVGPHQAERVDCPVKPLDDQRQETEKVPPVVVVHEQPRLVDGFAGDVIDAVGQDAAEHSRHSDDGTARRCRQPPPRTFSPLSPHPRHTRVTLDAPAGATPRV
jgi:hypothetical protein